jgi:hypothetical protein
VGQKFKVPVTKSQITLVRRATKLSSRLSQLGVKKSWGSYNKGYTILWSILRQKKNYENLNISPCKNIIFKKSSERNQNPSRYYN